MSTPNKAQQSDSTKPPARLPPPLRPEQLLLDHLDEILAKSFGIPTSYPQSPRGQSIGISPGAKDHEGQSTTTERGGQGTDERGGQSIDKALRALVISPGRAQLAWQLAKTTGFSTVQAWYVDLHDAAQASESVNLALGDPAESLAESPAVSPAEPSSLEGSPADKSHGIDVLCGADLPDGEFDLIAMPTLKRTEAEWTRELLQQAYLRLSAGGVLATSVDNAKDSWLHDQLKAKFDKVTSVRSRNGNVYWAKKTKPLKKEKDFGCEFAFRDGEQMVRCYSRPGVFSHRRLDNGARQLLLTAEIGPHDHVLDMGCGCGPVTLAAAFQTDGNVFGVDSNARAIQCLKRGAELNSLQNIIPVWNADGQIELPVAIDIALANPPYFAEQAIAQHFVDTALALLRPGGALLAVTKQPSWYESYFYHLLDDVAIFEASRYFVACGRKPEVGNQ